MKSVWKRRAAVMAGVVFAAFLLSALSVARAEQGVTIRIFQFQPNRHEVKAGAMVTWTNQDEIEHTVTSGSPEAPDGRFSHTLRGKGATASVTFAEPGTYRYFCNRHQSMRGEIHVR